MRYPVLVRGQALIPTVFVIIDKIILYDLHICCDSQRIKLFIFYSVVCQLFSVPVQKQINKAYPQDNYYNINNTQKIHSHTTHIYNNSIKISLGMLLIYRKCVIIQLMTFNEVDTRIY